MEGGFMATEFILEAVTPERLVFEKPVEFVKLRTESGDIGILAKHINYITAIGAGEMLVREKDKEDVTYYLEGGFLEVRQDKVVILGVNIVEATKSEAERMAREVAIEKAKNQKIKEDRDILETKKRIQSNLSKK
jgi:ATP synthase F1, epsilon subunit